MIFSLISEKEGYIASTLSICFAECEKQTNTSSSNLLEAQMSLVEHTEHPETVVGGAKSTPRSRIFHEWVNILSAALQKVYWKSTLTGSSSEFQVVWIMLDTTIFLPAWRIKSDRVDEFSVNISMRIHAIWIVSLSLKNTNNWLLSHWWCERVRVDPNKANDVLHRPVMSNISDYSIER